jgi:glycogen debranching enzyme
VPAEILEGHLVVKGHVAEGGRWRTCFDVVPVFDGARRVVDRSCTTFPIRAASQGERSIVRGPRLRSSADALEHLWAHALMDLEALEIEIENTRVLAAGIPWFVTLFGRDSIISSIEAMLVDREVGLGTARLLARLQGTQTVPATSEEPGKILHELRHGERSFPLEQMSRYFGGVDTTPLWCMLVEKLWRWGTDAQDIQALLPALRAAVDWILRALEAGGGFLTYTGDTTRLVNQCWKDSEDSIVDSTGALLEPPIAVVEAQAYAVAALRSAARLEVDLGEASRAAPLNAAASELQRRLDEVFWREEFGTYDLAIGSGGVPARSLSSNPGHVLWAEAAEPARAGRVAASLVDAALWSGWGVRTLSGNHPAYHPISYHRGSVWPHDTMLAIAGLISYGRLDEALTLAGGLLAAAADFSYELPELFSGIARAEVPRPIGYPTSSSPQAWAAAVPIYLTEQLLGLRPDLPAGQLIVAPRLPAGVELSLDRLPLGDGFLSLQAEGRSVRLLELPTGLNVIVR